MVRADREGNRCKSVCSVSIRPLGSRAVLPGLHSVGRNRAPRALRHDPIDSDIRHTASSRERLPAARGGSAFCRPHRRGPVANRRRRLPRQEAVPTFDSCRRLTWPGWQPAVPAPFLPEDAKLAGANPAFAVAGPPAPRRRWSANHTPHTLSKPRASAFSRPA